jgi:hypothetical protein
VAGAVPGAALTGVGAGVAAFRQMGAQGGLKSLVDDLRAVDPQLEGRLAAADSLLALIVDTVGLDPDLLPGSRFEAASLKANVDALDRVLAMLADSDGWVHQEQIRRNVDVTPGSLARALEAAAVEGLLDQTQSNAFHTRHP